MLITFKSKAAGDVMMFAENAQQIIEIMGKQWDRQGIITVEQLPEAIARLRRAVSEHKAQHAPHAPHAQDEHDAEPDDERRPVVGLAQRAVPILELLDLSLKGKTPVIWGT